MVEVNRPEAPLSLFRVTLRRSAALGKFYLVYGTGMSLLLGIALGASRGAAFPSSFPLVLPIFGGVASIGAITVFTSDRMKGALEYFLAYGLSPRRLFAYILASSLVLVALVVGIAAAVGTATYVARGGTVTPSLAEGILVYALPMAFASAALTTIVSMYWSALSSPRAGMNSPVGLAPLFGVAPPAAVLVVVGLLAGSGTVPTSDSLEIAVLAMGAVAVTSVALLALSGRLLLRERFLSPA
jgi:hypothetical protein